MNPDDGATIVRSTSNLLFVANKERLTGRECLGRNTQVRHSATAMIPVDGGWTAMCAKRGTCAISLRQAGG